MALYPSHLRTISFGFIFYVLFTVGCKSNDSTRADEAYAKGDFSTAISLYTNYLAEHPNDEKSLYNRGRAYEEMSDFDKAISDFAAVSKLDRTNTMYHMAIGICNFKMKKYGDVVFGMNVILKQKHTDIDALVLRGRANMYIGEVKKSLEDFDAAIRFEPNAAQAYLHRGILNANTKKEKEGCADFEKAIALGAAQASEYLKQYCNR